MKAILLMAIFLAVFAVGCKKNKQDIANPSSLNNTSPSALNDSDRQRRAPEPNRIQVAKGEMRELLLALRRVHFSFDSSTLGSNSRSALDDAADKLRSIVDVDLYVDGHTDERGTTEYNMSLGERRARTVVNYLKNSGVEPNRLSIVSFGEEKPMAIGAGKRQYAMNRRVEYRLMRGKVQFVLEEGELVDDDGMPLGAQEEEEAHDKNAEDGEERPEDNYPEHVEDYDDSVIDDDI